MDIDVLREHRNEVLDFVDLPDLPNLFRGKVRDNYDLDRDRRLIAASDRISVFDIIVASIPFKGQVLTETARYWFEATNDICPNHVIAYPDPNVLIARRLDILPVEIIVRGYLAGSTGTSLLTLYKKGQRHIYGHTLPDGLRDNQQLPTPLITPTSKAAMGGHDEPLSAADVLKQGLMTAEQWQTVSRYALALFARGQEMAAKQGLILADTKYEFGIDETGAIVLADEIHTPDSSRYWVQDTYEARLAAGQTPQSFDKDFIRQWVRARCDPYTEPVPQIPAELVLQASQVYIDAFEKITGQTFRIPADNKEPLERIRKNVATFLAAVEA